MPNTPIHVAEQLLAARGQSDPGLRKAVYDLCRNLNDPSYPKTNGELPPDLGTYATKVATRAYSITDDEFDKLKSIFGEEEIYELNWAAILGAADGRYARTLSLLGEQEDG